MKTVLRILIVEDDKYFQLHLAEILRPFGTPEMALSWKEARLLLQDNIYDLVVTDLNLESGPDGIQVLEMAQSKSSMRVMVTSCDDEALITEAYRLGAQHVLTKNQVREHLPAYIKGLMAQRNFHEIHKMFEERFPTQDETLKNSVTKLLTRPWQEQSLLITGPTGTGKSVLGKLLGEKILGPAAPFIHINCSELSDQLLESELFGHEKGAFTGAHGKREGKIKAAHNGVLFLDEVATMSMAMQQKLLKVLEEKTFYPVGSDKKEKSSFILIAATCENLKTKMTAGDFREDLYFRLSNLSLHIPSLKDRIGDIALLTKMFQAQSPRRFIITNDAFDALQTHTWPGNIRELKQVIKELSESGAGVVERSMVTKVLHPSDSLNPSVGLLNEEIRNHIKQHGLRSYFQIVEKQMASELLEQHGGKITSCIRDLKISSSAFYRILQNGT